jgi:hypothetical protein
MIVVCTPKFSEQLASALDFGILRFGKQTAEHPRVATYAPEFDAYRSWMPKTPISRDARQPHKYFESLRQRSQSDIDRDNSRQHCSK